MTKKIIQFALVLLLLAGVCTTAHARIMRSWNYKELSEKSELIVIGIQKQDSEITQNTIILPELSPDTKANEVITEFAVAGILKGAPDGKTIKLRHYALPDPNQLMINSPGLVSFDPNQRFAYLLFLKKGADGIYEPMAGQTDPNQAVKKLDGMTYTDYAVDFLLKEK